MNKIKKTNRTLVMVSIMFAIFMAAVEATIVATAMPSIVGKLGGFSLYSWVFSAFLLAQAVTIPIYGKLTDLYGRKPVFTIGVMIFLFGSILCGLAQSMQMLIIFRIIQGIGAAAVQPVAITIVGDLYSSSERAKIQGFISGVWGGSAIVGPAVGGLIVQYMNWAWIFWLNLPIGILALLGIFLFLKENVVKQDHSIDYLGSGLIFIGVSALMVLLIQSGLAWPWLSIPTISLLGIVVVCFVFFIKHEKRVPEPVMPLGIWQNRLIVVSNLATLTTGVVLIGLSSFLPTFVQGVMGKSPIMAGFALASMSVAWMLASIISGNLLHKVSIRLLSITGGIFIILGSLIMLTLRPESSWVWATTGSFLIGIGMGLARTVFIIAIQNSVDWQTRGVVTASNMFMNILGNTLGAALLGSILNNRLNDYLRSSRGGQGAIPNLDVVNILLDPAQRALVSTDVLLVMKEGLASALQGVFGGVFIMALLSLLIITLLPRNNTPSSSY